MMSKQLLRNLSLVVLFFVSTSISRADVIPIPSDVATIEALIDFHQMEIKQLQRRIDHEIANMAQQKVVTSKTQKYKNIKTRLDKKFRDSYCWLQFAASASTSANYLLQILNEEKKYVNYVATHAKKKPILLLDMANAHSEINRRVKEVRNLIASITIQKLNIMMVDDKQRFTFMAVLEERIWSLRNYIRQQQFLAECKVQGYMKAFNMKDAINSDVGKAIKNKVLAMWKKKKAE